MFGPWSSEFIILDFRFGFYTKFYPRNQILRSVDLPLTLVLMF